MNLVWSRCERSEGGPDGWRQGSSRRHLGRGQRQREGGRGGATDNEDLEAEGKKDQTKGAGKAWGATKDAADEVKDAAGKAKDAVKEKVDDD